MRTAGFGVLILAAPIVACSMPIENAGSLLVQPGRYQFLRCQDLTARSAELSRREQELTSLIERANQGVAGPLVSAMAYSLDLEQVRADLRLVRQTAMEKNCDLVSPRTSGKPEAGR